MPDTVKLGHQPVVEDIQKRRHRIGPVALLIDIINDGREKWRVHAVQAEEIRSDRGRCIWFIGVSVGRVVRAQAGIGRPLEQLAKAIEVKLCRMVIAFPVLVSIVRCPFINPWCLSFLAASAHSMDASLHFLDSFNMLMTDETLHFFTRDSRIIKIRRSNIQIDIPKNKLIIFI
ncbi:hypothetical protein GCM10023078_46960 [Gibbsiella greigii]